jgi:hypothetical protein
MVVAVPAYGFLKIVIHELRETMNLTGGSTEKTQNERITMMQK